MRAFKLTASGDLDTTGGKLAVVEGGDACVQRLRALLSIAHKEWFLNRRYGVDYFGRVLPMDVPDHEREQAFREALASDPEVSSVRSVTFEHNNDGVGVVGFEVVSIYGVLGSAAEAA